MSISRQDVEAVARLAHLELSEDAAARMAETLGSILDYMAVLGEADVADVHAEAGASALLRDDEPHPGLSPEDALAQAPEAAGSLFKVPPMLAGSDRP
jgi:aspartyl-tRNA(Asn)/glutamyl-tRNA(Gln) amidotransferase subunit C